MSGTIMPRPRPVVYPAPVVAPSPQSQSPQSLPRSPQPRHGQEAPTDSSSNNGLKGWQKAFLAAAFTLGFTAMAASLGFSAAHDGRFMPGVSVASVPVGGLTRPEARQALLSHLNGHRISFSVAGKVYNLSPDEVGARYDVNATLDQAYLIARHPSLGGILQSSAKADIPYSYSLDTRAEEALVKSVVEASGMAPVDATIIVDNGIPRIKDDASGRALSASAVKSAIDTQIGDVSASAPSLEPVVQPARIKAADVAPAVDETRSLLTVPVEITYQAKTFHPTSAEVGAWLVFDKTPADAKPDVVPSFSTDAIKAYLEVIASQINVKPVTREVNVENGVAKETKPGQEGIELDQDSLASQIAAGLETKKPVTIAAPTKPVPFQTQYNQTITLDYGRYIEVNLARQHMWVYQDHNIIYDAPITSGATGAGFPTATGLFSILAKQTNRHLVGYQYGPRYNYDVFVRYWMPFYQGYGLHDASWRSSFGGGDYYYNGSHGCVNLPDAAAAFLYGWATVGTPVWVHG